MNRSILLSVALIFAGCHARRMESRSIVFMGPHKGDVLWSFHESGDELGSGGELQIFVDPKTHPEAKASFAKYMLGVGGALPVHLHDKTEEFTCILSGDGTAVTVNDAGDEVEVSIGAGCFFYVPPGTWHALRNKGQAPLVLVFATVPNEAHGLLSFFRKISVEPGQEPIILAADDLERLAAEHDLILRTPLRR
jgi:mannose-6-phosphate isomerase-like protein (cupin superfamily)